MIDPNCELEKFIKQYECGQYDKLPNFIKRRVDALKKIQLEHINIQLQYNKRLQELEIEFEKLYKPLYEKRFQIVSGHHEPTDEECQLPANLAEDEFNGDQENVGEDKPKPILNETQEAQYKNQVKGIPGFWLGCLASTYNFSDSIEDHDREVLRYLNDIRLVYSKKDDYLTYTLEFHFDENPFFSNKVLTKTYFMKTNPEEKNPFAYDGFEVCKSEGCEINWYPGKKITTHTVTVKQMKKTNGATREKKKETERDSFFFFFKPPQIPEGHTEDDIDEELAAIMAVDFELGEVIRQSIIPKAPLYYMGYMLDDEDDDEDDDDDEHGFLPDETDDSDDDSYDDDEDEETDASSDSLANNENSKRDPSSASGNKSLFSDKSLTKHDKHL